jgi:hypothetical protein
MDPQQNPAPASGSANELCAHAGGLWRKASAQIARIPVTGRVLLGFFLLAGVLMAVYMALASKDATLRLKVQHGFRSAQFSMWIDGDLAYSCKLIGAPVKKFGLLPGSIQGSLSETFPISSGAHQVRVRIVSDEGATQEDSIEGGFTRNSQRTLSVNARRNDVSLNWQGSEMQVAESAAANTGWFNRYAGTLLMTVAGSIVSALTGYMIRELPKQIGSRSGEIPKV